jgi:serine/threonine-protein kinase
MKVILTVLAGPNVGHIIPFDGHDTFVVGRSKRTSAALPHKDPYLSRYHFLIEINPPLCRVLDLESHNGMFVNGEKVPRADLLDGDILKAGHTAFRVGVEPDATLSSQVFELDGPTSMHSPPLESGALVPGFQLIRELGQGGMGIVYEAIREADRLAVALKVIRPTMQPTRAVVERFLREVAVLRKLDHPNIVRLIDTGESRGRLWFAMEYVPGVDASRWVKSNGPMTISSAVSQGI